MNKYTLKELQALVSRKVAQREGLVIEFQSLSKELKVLRDDINKLNSEIKDYLDKEIEPITEHVILRYLERVKGIDIAAIKAEVMEHVKVLYPMNGEVIGTINDKKYRFVIKNRQVITVTEK